MNIWLPCVGLNVGFPCVAFEYALWRLVALDSTSPFFLLLCVFMKCNLYIPSDVYAFACLAPHFLKCC